MSRLAAAGAGAGGRAGRSPGWSAVRVFDLSPVRAEVTEHQLVERECGCGHRTKAAPRRGAEAPVEYGPRIAGVMVYLYAGQCLSKERTARALAELFGVPLSSGTVAAVTAGPGKLDGFLERAHQWIAASGVAGLMRPGSGWTGSWRGCTAPAPAPTPC